MHFLYLDDSGSAKNPQDQHFVLAGISLLSSQIDYLSRSLDDVLVRIGVPEDRVDEVEFHGTHMLPGKGYWRQFPKQDRKAYIRHALACIRDLYPGWTLFGAVIDKRAIDGLDPIEFAFEQICNRFDMRIGRRNRDHQRRDRGLIILDKSTRETRLQSLATEFRKLGHRWGRIHNIAEVPLFVDSKASRVVQMADLIAYSLYQNYEKGNGEFFDIFRDDFDQEGGVVHGLVHWTPKDMVCSCPACASRNTR